MKEATITPFAKPLYIMTKPVGAVCNLACEDVYKRQAQFWQFLL